jgi:DeoR/GlpR family transcriptional regulator of sugar metabolism
MNVTRDQNWGDGNGFTQAARQERIAERVLGSEFVSAKDLAESFAVSLMTIHRDLDELEGRGMLRKVRGGATPMPSSLFESTVRYRLTAAAAEKEALARYALRFIQPGQAVMLDNSTTTLALARLLPSIGPLTIITNFHAVLREIGMIPQIRLILLGGQYMPQHDAFTGLVCEAAINALRADVVFMSTTAITNGTAFQPEQDESLVKRAMLGAASRRILLVDHHKFGRSALHRTAALRDFDLVVVDSGIDEAGLQQLRDAKVPFEVAPLT